MAYNTAAQRQNTCRECNKEEGGGKSEWASEWASDEYKIICIQVPFSIFINSFSISLSRISGWCCCCVTRRLSVRQCWLCDRKRWITCQPFRFNYSNSILLIRLPIGNTQCIGTRTPAFMCAHWVCVCVSVVLQNVQVFNAFTLLGENGRIDSKNGFVIFNLSRLCIAFAHELRRLSVLPM